VHWASNVDGAASSAYCGADTSSVRLTIGDLKDIIMTDRAYRTHLVLLSFARTPGCGIPLIDASAGGRLRQQTTASTCAKS
jgi:hypothetical protein